MDLIRSTSRNVFFNNGEDNDPAREHKVLDGEVCLILPIEATCMNCVVVLCRYGVREILYLTELDKLQ